MAAVVVEEYADLLECALQAWACAQMQHLLKEPCHLRIQTIAAAGILLGVLQCCGGLALATATCHCA
eukprot:9480206-Prorocentrum_lima.AAC.1